MATFDISALTAAFVGGAEVFGKRVQSWDLRKHGIQIRTNVNTPQAMAKFSADGAPQPYRKQDDFAGGTFTDRVLTAYQSKMDLELDGEELRNTYLATLPQYNGGVMPFEQFVVDEAAKKFLSSIYTSTIYGGVRNGAGTAVADIADGYGTLIAAAITAAEISPVATGAITSANAVTKVEQIVDEIRTSKPWMADEGFVILCSYSVLGMYRTHYRSLNGFGFNKNERDEYQLDGVNAVLCPAAFMGSSQRLIGTVNDNLVFGTDLERVTMYPTPYLNTLKTRLMMPVGCQIRDLDVLVVNDQA